MKLKRHISLLTFLAALLLVTNVHGRIILNGKVADRDGMPLPGIMIRLYEKEKIKAFASSKKDGTFSLKTDTLTFPARITFASTNYSPLEIWADNDSDSISATLTPQHYDLEEVTVKAPHVRVKGDTITYDVASYTSKGDRNIEDVIKKIPGVEVSENGSIYYDGEPINNFYIEGLNLMGGNYKVASQNIRPQDISSVSVYQRHQPTKALKGIQDSKKAALNLKLKKGRMLRPVGYFSGGAGYGDECLWDAGMYSMLISPKNQTILSASANNRGFDAITTAASDNFIFTLFPVKPFGIPSIATSRYMFNKTASFSANTLMKLKEDLNVTVNSSYYLDHDTYRGGSYTEYLASGMENPVYSETVDNTLRRHIVTAGAKIEKNSDRLYFLDQFSFKGKFNNNAYDIRNSGSVRQKMGNHGYYFTNNLSSIVRSGRNAWEIKSLTTFQNIPSNHISVCNPETGAVSMYQFATGRSFHNSESTGFTWKSKKRSRTGINLKFSIDHDSFLSEASGENPTSDFNNISGHKLSVDASPFYTFTIPGRFSFTLTIPVEWRNLRYSDLIDGHVHRLNKLYLSPKFDFFYSIRNTHYFDGGAEWKHDTGDIRNFIDNPIHTTFRNSTTPGNGNLVKTLSKSANLSYIWKKPVSGYYLRGMVSFINRTSNSLSIYDVSQSGTSGSSANLNSSSSTTNLNITGVRNFFKYHTRLYLNLTGVWMERENMRASSLIKVKSASYIANFKVETSQFNDILSLSTNFSWSMTRQSFGSVMPPNDLKEISVNGSLSIFPVKNIEIYGKLFFNRSQISEDTYKSNTFIDAGIRYRIHKFELELAGRNLSNLKRYAYTIYRSLDISTYSYDMRPIEGVFSLRYNF